MEVPLDGVPLLRDTAEVPVRKRGTTHHLLSVGIAFDPSKFPAIPNIDV